MIFSDFVSLTSLESSFLGGNEYMLQMLYYRNFSLWWQSCVSCCFGLILLISQPSNMEDMFGKKYSRSSSHILHVNKLVTEIQDVCHWKRQCTCGWDEIQEFLDTVACFSSSLQKAWLTADSEYSLAEAKAGLNNQFFDGATGSSVSIRPSNFSIGRNIFKINWCSIFGEVLKTFLTEEVIPASIFFWTAHKSVQGTFHTRCEKSYLSILWQGFSWTKSACLILSKNWIASWEKKHSKMCLVAIFFVLVKKRGVLCTFGCISHAVFLNNHLLFIMVGNNNALTKHK